MKNLLLKFCLAALPAMIAGASIAPAEEMRTALETERHPADDAAPAPATAPVHVFAFAVGSKSAEARTLVESALDQYENVWLDRSVESARRAIEKDPHFALAYAVEDR